MTPQDLLEVFQARWPELFNDPLAIRRWLAALVHTRLGFRAHGPTLEKLNAAVFEIPYADWERIARSIPVLYGQYVLDISGFTSRPSPLRAIMEERILEHDTAIAGEAAHVPDLAACESAEEIAKQFERYYADPAQDRCGLSHLHSLAFSTNIEPDHWFAGSALGQSEMLEYSEELLRAAAERLDAGQKELYVRNLLRTFLFSAPIRPSNVERFAAEYGRLNDALDALLSRSADGFNRALLNACIEKIRPLAPLPESSGEAADVIRRYLRRRKSAPE